MSEKFVRKYVPEYADTDGETIVYEIKEQYIPREVNEDHAVHEAPIFYITINPTEPYIVINIEDDSETAGFDIKSYSPIKIAKNGDTSITLTTNNGTVTFSEDMDYIDSDYIDAVNDIVIAANTEFISL